MGLLDSWLWRDSTVLRGRAGCWLRSGSTVATTALMRTGILARHNIDKEVKHVRLHQGRCNVGSLQCAALVLFCVDPGTHGELRDEDVAALGKQDGSFGRDHLDFRIGLHDLLDTG